MKGGDLDVRFKKLKKENVRLSEEQILDWTVQLLIAINYMHSRRVLHRDLKARFKFFFILFNQKLIFFLLL
jgi:serine/threonine protein kinase